jgi:HD-GYP domain-containing protein (c-di-GMP phosphodiesterase class II)
MLHDVGKIGISEQILRKPGRLTNEEFDEIKQHPMYGVQLFEEAGLGNLLSEELLALAQHHERLDGRGYPYGLRGERISRIGRIVAVADVFDALTSDRTYRAAFSGDEAIALLQDMAGTELDAACVAALAQARKEGKILVQNEREEQPHQAT